MGLVDVVQYMLRLCLNLHAYVPMCKFTQMNVRLYFSLERLRSFIFAFFIVNQRKHSYLRLNDLLSHV